MYVRQYHFTILRCNESNSTGLSQKGRGWEGPLDVFWSNLLLKQSNLEQVAQHHIQTAFEYLQGGKHYNLFGQSKYHFIKQI